MAGDKIQVLVQHSEEPYVKFVEKFVIGKVVKYAAFDLPTRIIASQIGKMAVAQEVTTIDGTMVVPVVEKELAEISEKGLFTLNMLLYSSGKSS